MNTILISGYGVRLRYRRGVLIVEPRGEDKQEVPIINVDQVVIATSGVWLSSKLVRKLVEHGVDIVFLDTRGLPIGRVYPPFVNRTVETRRSQYLAYNTHRGIHAAREIVFAKLSNQAMLLKKYYYYTEIQEIREASTRVASIAHKVRELEGSLSELKEKLRVLEAEAARIYWSGYAILLPRDLSFEGRDQDSTDPVNTSLNYAYGILYGECWKALVLAGLDPYAGFIHEDRSGKPTLVFDFVEMFRFIADASLLALFRRGWKPSVNNAILDYESRRKIVENIHSFIEKTKTTYIDEAPVNLKQVIKKVALALASYLRGEGVFEGYVHRW
ncbi:MAG: CRISPR-associated endonuclease Cas1 [Desulfurococcaceae archaeon]